MLEDLLIHPEIPIYKALKRFNTAGEKALMIVSEENKLLGVVTDGDIRRAVLSGVSMEDSLSGIYNPSPNFIYERHFDIDTVRNILLKDKIDLLPVVDKNGRVVDYITWKMAFSEYGFVQKKTGAIQMPRVIMAGGKGTRLEPVTTIIPKPLIPVGQKTIVEHIMERFKECGVDEFYFTLNYLGEMIKAYLNSVDSSNTLHYVFEEDYYGTAGSLKLLTQDLPHTFIVSNCDILVNADYYDVVHFHESNQSFLTMLSAFQAHRIPYGVIDFKEDGVVTQIHEKPEKTVVINTGVYVVAKECLAYIPDGKQFHITELVEALIKDGKKVCTYPVNERDYVDIGQWDEYRKAVKLFS